MASYTSTKAQAWYLDFVIGLTIMTIAFVIFLSTTSEILNKESDEFGSALSDAGRISGMLLTPGYPENWDNQTVELIGITQNNRINNTKLVQADAISYDETRKILGTRHDYFVVFRDANGNIKNLGGFCGLGNAQSSVLNAQLCTNFSIEASHVAKQERLVIYNSEITEMVTFVWE